MVREAPVISTPISSLAAAILATVLLTLFPSMRFSGLMDPAASLSTDSRRVNLSDPGSCLQNQ
jgi:hypothetical protein